MSTYADRIDVLKNPMLCVGMPVSVVFDLSDGSQIALNEVDAREWCARNPNQFSRTATRADMGKQVEPKAITGQIDLTHLQGVPQASQLILDNVTGTKYALPSVDSWEWLLRGGGRYQIAS